MALLSLLLHCHVWWKRTRTCTDIRYLKSGSHIFRAHAHQPVPKLPHYCPTAKQGGVDQTTVDTRSKTAALRTRRLLTPSTQKVQISQGHKVIGARPHKQIGTDD